MTPEQKEAFRREVLEEAARVCDERGVREQADFGLNRGTQNYFRARDAIRVLATQPAPAADTGQAVAVIGKDYQLLWASAGTLVEIVAKHGIKVGSLLYTHPAPLDAERVREDELLRAAQDCLDEVDKMLAIDPPPIKYRAPYGSLARLRAAIRQMKGKA